VVQDRVDRVGSDADGAWQQRQQDIPPSGVLDAGHASITCSGLSSRAGAHLAAVTAGQLAGVVALRTPAEPGKVMPVSASLACHRRPPSCSSRALLA
jgi:hypothetical protein